MILLQTLQNDGALNFVQFFFLDHPVLLYGAALSEISDDVTDLGRFKPEAFLYMFQSERDEDVESFADGLEHDKVEWNSRQRIEHTKDLSARSLRRAVAVT